MTIEVALAISLISLTLGIISTTANLRRNSKTDDRAESAQITTVIVKLENIGKDITDIKNDLKDVKDDIKEHTERIIRLEQQVKMLNSNKEN